MDKVVAVVLLSAALCGCDLNANLVFRNRSGALARVRSVEKRDTTTNEYTRTLDASGTGSRMPFSMGFWRCFRGTALEENVSRFQRIDIITGHDSTAYAGADL
ncbi:MAG: hypothetical protein JNL43_15330 [Flavobacteriales bacterium]|nr:hypothetical protein [Flavobacteriales bacterium]